MIYFAVVTFGSGNYHGAPTKGRIDRGIYTNRSSAAELANQLVGTGSCTSARVIACASLDAAHAADISDPPKECYVVERAGKSGWQYVAESGEYTDHLGRAKGFASRDEAARAAEDILRQSRVTDLNELRQRPGR